MLKIDSELLEKTHTKISGKKKISKSNNEMCSAAVRITSVKDLEKRVESGNIIYSILNKKGKTHNCKPCSRKKSDDTGKECMCSIHYQSFKKNPLNIMKWKTVIETGKKVESLESKKCKIILKFNKKAYFLFS